MVENKFWNWWFSTPKAKIQDKIKNASQEELEKIVGSAGPKSAKRVLSPTKYIEWKAAQSALHKLKESSKLSSKDLIIGDDDDEQLKLNKKKRKTEALGIPEAISVSQRRKMSLRFKKNKAKVKRGQEKAKRRIASPEKLKSRARKHARDILAKKLTKGIPKSELSPGRKSEIEKKLSKMKTRIDRIAKKELKNVRKAEMSKKRK